MRKTHSTLRELGADCGMRIGTAVNVKAFTEDHAYRHLVLSEFSSLTHENAMKFSKLRPESEIWDFTDADILVQAADENAITLRGHTLVWNEMLPPWLESSLSSRRTALHVLEKHIERVIDRYRDHIPVWDVVNEAIMEDGSMREGLWLRNIGPEYVSHAFQVARAIHPKGKLFYNDYICEGGGSSGDTVYRFVQKLLDQGISIDGVGLQMHLLLEHPPHAENMSKSITRFTELGLEVHLTEIDVRCPMPYTSDMEESQAEVYKSVVDVACQIPAVTSLTFWGCTDKYSWIPHHFAGHGSALPFDDLLRPKPAYHAIVQTLSHHRH